MTNASAIGYALLALKRMRILSRTLTAEFEALMREEMDLTTEEEAEQAYNKN